MVDNGGIEANVVAEEELKTTTKEPLYDSHDLKTASSSSAASSQNDDDDEKKPSESVLFQPKDKKKSEFSGSKAYRVFSKHKLMVTNS